MCDHATGTRKGRRERARKSRREKVLGIKGRRSSPDNALVPPRTPGTHGRKDTADPSHTVGPGVSRKRAKAHAQKFYKVATTSRSVPSFKTRVETLAKRVLPIVGADAVVFSLSASGGYIIGVGAGFEAVYSRHFGWATYFQAGLGLTTPGGAAVLEVGFIWGLKGPAGYRGLFIEGAGAAGGGGALASGSVFFSPSPGAEPRGAKAGAGVGTPGVSVLVEWYWQLTGMESGDPDVAFNQYYTFYLPSILNLGQENGFVVQFNPVAGQPRRVQMQILYKKKGLRKKTTFQLSKDKRLNPKLLKVDKNSAEFDVDGDKKADLFLKVPPYCVLRVDTLNVGVVYRGNTLIRLSYPGIPMGKLPNGKEYFLVPGTEHVPGGPRYVDEDSKAAYPMTPSR